MSDEATEACRTAGAQQFDFFFCGVCALGTPWVRRPRASTCLPDSLARLLSLFLSRICMSLTSSSLHRAPPIRPASLSVGRLRLCSRGLQRTVPAVFIHGNLIGGCDDSFALMNSGKLAELLKSAKAAK